MLVLSRNETEKLVFPNLGVSIEILQINRGRVRIGVDAPPEITVLRHELYEERLKNGGVQATVKRFDHDLRNKMNTANLSLTLAKKLLELGVYDRADETLKKAIDEFQSIDQKIATLPESKITALVVEDNANESGLLAEVLKLSGFDVRTAADGFEAIEKLRESCPDAVLLDMNMPRCDGATTIKKIREDHRFDQVLLYAVSGSSPHEYHIPIGPEGVKRWFAKPISVDSLIQALKAELSTSFAV